MTCAVSYYNNNSEVNIALYLNILKTILLFVIGTQLGPLV